MKTESQRKVSQHRRFVPQHPNLVEQISKMEKRNIENKKASFKASMKQQLIVQQGGSKYGHRDTQIGDDMFDEKYLPKFNEFSQRDKLLKTTLISKYIDSSICCDTREIPKLKIPLGGLKNESGPETFD